MAGDLKKLFQDPGMFDSPGCWQRAGFRVDGRGTLSNIMVASHPTVRGYLFKRYSKKISLKDQSDNYHRRIDGAEKLRSFIMARQLTRIVVPRKYLHTLPSEFSRKGETSYVLVVEHLPLLKSSDSKSLYRQLDHEGLRQLCEVLGKFRGLDSGVRNIPFTTEGQIAFIDTERWSETRETKIYLRRIRGYLSQEQFEIVKTFKSAWP